MYIALNNGLLSVRYASITRADCSAANPLSFYKKTPKKLNTRQDFPTKKRRESKICISNSKNEELDRLTSDLE